MFFFKVFVLIFLLRKNCASFVGVGIDDVKSNLPSFVNGLISDYKSKDSATHDVVVIRYSHFQKSRINVEAMFSAIVQAVGFENPITTPSISHAVTDGNIRKASFFIIVTDVFWPVSIKFLNIASDRINLNFHSNCFTINSCLPWKVATGNIRLNLFSLRLISTKTSFGMCHRSSLFSKP